MESYIVDIMPIGHEGQEVLVKYFDTDTYELKTKKDKFPRITVTRELIPAKHKITPKQLIAELKAEYPGHYFQAMPYGKIKLGVNDQFDLPIDSQKSFIVWHRGNREDAKNLEFFVKGKQIFFRNPEKKYKARTYETFEIDELNKIAEELLGIEQVLIDDLILNFPEENEKKYPSKLELLCNKEILERLDRKKFRINVYNSEIYDSKNEFDKYYQITLGKINRDYRLKNNIDIKKDIEFIDKEKKKKFYMKVTATLDDVVDANLKLLGLKPRIINGKHEIDATLMQYDPLLLNRASKQLREFFPIHSTFNPTIPLTWQPNYRLFPFLYLKDVDYGTNIDTALEHCRKFYEKNTAVIDLEVIDFIKKQVPSGRVFMATLNSQSENKIYITKEAWNNKEYVDQIKNKFSDIKFEIFEDEIRLIAQLNYDASKYYKVIGHNFIEYDREHLVKFNDPNKSLKSGKITSDEYEEIKALNKKYGTKKLWEKKLEDIIDTKEYISRRIDILADHKLATFAGFTKSIDYDEMIDLIKSGTYEGLEKVIDYTINDGLKNREFVNKILINSLIESLAVNKSIDSVFNSDPVKNFYDAGERRYFMKINTLRDRHEMSPKKHLKKLKSRLRPDEILMEYIQSFEQKFGEGNGYLYYPNILIESFKPIIMSDHVLHYIYDKMQNEKNIILKTDLIWKLASALVVPIDKAKDCMEMAKLEFGKKYLLAEMYPSLLEADPDEQRRKYFSKILRDGKSERDVANTSFIFNQEYVGKVWWRYVNKLIYDDTIMALNNTFAEMLEKLNEVKFEARSESYIISSLPPEDYPGYDLGPMHYLNLKDNWVVGKIDDKEIYLNVKKFNPKKEKPDYETQKTMKELVDTLFNNKITDKAPWIDRVYAMPVADQNNGKNREFIKRILNIDPKKSQGTLSLFD